MTGVAARLSAACEQRYERGERAGGHTSKCHGVRPSGHSIEKAVPSKKTLPTHKSLREGGRAQERVSLSDKECKGVVVGRTKFVF